MRLEPNAEAHQNRLEKVEQRQARDQARFEKQTNDNIEEINTLKAGSQTMAHHSANQAEVEAAATKQLRQ